MLAILAFLTNVPSHRLETDQGQINVVPFPLPSKKSNAYFDICPIEKAERSTKDEFYSELSTIVSEVHKKGILIVLGDLNAKIGSENHNIEHIIGKYGLGVKNENEDLLFEMCEEANLVIGESLFLH